MTKLANIIVPGAGAFTVYHDKNAKQNPYRVYHEYKEWEPFADGGYIPHKKKILKAKYADYKSCAYLIYQYIANLENGGIIKP